MKSYEASDYFFLNKSTYINLRWIGIIGQLFTINLVALVFKFEFNFVLANFVVFIGVISNFSLLFFHKSTQFRVGILQKLT